MKLVNILSEVEFYTYTAMVRVTFEDSNATELAELLRALPGVTTVSMAGASEFHDKQTFRIRLISQKSGEEAFQALKQNALTKYSPVKMVEIGQNTIEKK
jgi:hypothetical protein